MTSARTGVKPIDENIATMPIRLLYVRYLMSSFLYYKADARTPWTDVQFDYACKRLLDEWDTFEHPHKHLTDKQALRAGTGYHIQYPLIVESCAWRWLKSF